MEAVISEQMNICKWQGGGRRGLDKYGTVIILPLTSQLQCSQKDAYW